MRLPSVQHPSSKSLLQVRERDFNFRFLELTLLLALRSMGLVEFALDLKLDKNKTNLLGFGSFLTFEAHLSWLQEGELLSPLGV